MKNILIPFVFILIMFSMPIVSLAAPWYDWNEAGTPSINENEVNTPDLNEEEVLTPDNSGGLTNPLKSATLEGFLLAILDILLVFAMPIIVLFIMYAGFLYVTAQGDPGKIKTAHSALTWAVVGGVIIFGAKLIINVIQNTVNTL